MESKSLVICDPEADYAAKLASFLSGKKELPFQVRMCTSPEKALGFQGDRKIDVLLISEECAPEETKALQAIQTVILTGKDQETPDGERNVIFKYQSGEALFSRIIQMCLANETGDFCPVRKKASARLTGIYSPVHRLGQTAFALEYGKKMAREKNVLYLNLENYAGTDGYFPAEQGRDMSVLLYYAKQEAGNIGLILTTLVRQMDGMDYVAPARFPEELRLITEKEWKWLFSSILKYSVYDMLILDLSECVQGLYGILEQCDEIYLPVGKDRLAAAKLQQYREMLKRLGYGELWERMIQCDTGRTAA